MTGRQIRMILTILAVLASSLLGATAQIGAAHAAGKPRTPTAEHTYFTCMWHGQTVRLKHIHNNPVERYRDAVLVGRCTNLSTNDRYYQRLDGHSINVFVAWSHYPGLYVLHNALQGRQPVYGDWTFPVTTSAGGLHGVVTDSTTGKPIAAATVTARFCESLPTEHCTIQTAATDSKGAYAIHFYVPATYHVTVDAQGYATSPETVVTIRNGRSASSNFAMVYVLAATSLALTANPNPATVKSAVSLTANLSAPVGDGTVTFSGAGPSGSTFTTTTCVPAAGTCSVSFTPPVAGTWSITAAWSGDSTHAAGSNTVSVTVNALTTTLSVGATPNPVSVNGSANLTATLGAPVSDGTVTFTGTGPNGANFTAKTCTPTNGSCTVSFTPTVSGTWTIAANYTGDAQYGSLQASTQIAVSGATVTLALANSPSPLTVNTVGTLTATLSQPVSDGTVTFSFAGPNSASLPSTTCTPTNGSCSTTWQPTTAGAWTVTATWSGDSQYTGATGILPVSVVGGTATLTVTANPNPATLGGTTILTATFSAGVNDGTVTFSGSGPNGATFPNNLTCQPRNGSCSVNWTPSTPGTWTITAILQGSTTYSSTAGSVAVTVSGATGSLSLTASPNPLPVNEQGVLTATLAQPLSGVITFTGTSSSGTFTTTSCTLVNGTCSVVWQPTTAGTYAITASYAGNNGVGAASQTTTVTVGAAQFLAITETPDPLAVTQSGTVTATIQQPDGGTTVYFTFTAPNGTTITPQSCTVVNVSCSVSWQPTTPGLWTVSASWTGTVGTLSGQATIKVPVIGTGTTLALTSSSSTLAINQSDTLTATVSQQVSDGTITFTGTGPTSNAFPTRTCTPTNGTCQVSFQPVAAGTYTITATYSGDSTYSGSSASVTITVGGGQITVTANPTSLQPNQSDQVTATLPQALSGQVIAFSFQTSNGITLPTQNCTTISSGSCMVTWTPNETGTWTVTASALVNGQSTTETGSVQVVVSNSASQGGTLSIVAQPDPVANGQSADLVATLNGAADGDPVDFTVTPPSGSGEAAGSASCFLTNGSCIAAFTFDQTGTWTIMATTSDTALGAQIGYATETVQ